MAFRWYLSSKQENHKQNTRGLQIICLKGLKGNQGTENPEDFIQSFEMI